MSVSFRCTAEQCDHTHVCMYVCVYVLSYSVVSDSVTLWTAAHQTALSTGILQARILEWVALPSSRDLPNPGIEPRSPSLQVDSLSAEGSPYVCMCICVCVYIYIYIPKNICTYILFQVLFPYRLLHSIECSCLCYTLCPCCLCFMYSNVYHLLIPNSSLIPSFSLW